MEKFLGILKLQSHNSILDLPIPKVRAYIMKYGEKILSWNILILIYSCEVKKKKYWIFCLNLLKMLPHRDSFFNIMYKANRRLCVWVFWDYMCVKNNEEAKCRALNNTNISCTVGGKWPREGEGKSLKDREKRKKRKSAMMWKRRERV